MTSSFLTSRDKFDKQLRCTESKSTNIQAIENTLRPFIPGKKRLLTQAASKKEGKMPHHLHAEQVLCIERFAHNKRRQKEDHFKIFSLWKRKCALHKNRFYGLFLDE